MSIPVDLELKKAFGELQLKMQTTGKKITAIDTQIGVLKRLKKHIEMQYVSLPIENIKTYESVGRMFILSDIGEIKSSIQGTINQLSSRVTQLTENKQYLDKNLKQSQDNLREMVQLRKVQSEKST